MTHPGDSTSTDVFQLLCEGGNYSQQSLLYFCEKAPLRQLDAVICAGKVTPDDRQLVLDALKLRRSRKNENMIRWALAGGALTILVAFLLWLIPQWR